SALRAAAGTGWSATTAPRGAGWRAACSRHCARVRGGASRRGAWPSPARNLLISRDPMSGFPSVNFGQSEGGLFTAEEIARLMESEYQRALRYGHPLALLLVEIDRLESLHDLYGVESEKRILRAVAELLRSSTRASDVLGSLRDDHLLLVLPHATAAGAATLARRLLAGCR